MLVEENVLNYNNGGAKLQKNLVVDTILLKFCKNWERVSEKLREVVLCSPEGYH